MARREQLLKVVGWVLVVAITTLLAAAGGLKPHQVEAVAVLAIFIAGSLFFWEFRNAFALAGLALLFFLGAIDIPHAIAHSQLDVILFIIGMMIIIGFLEERGFFNWLVAKVLAPFLDRPAALLAVILFMSYLMSALVDEVTSILFMMAILFKLADVMGFDPIPVLLFMVFATNIGSSATVVGNPIGVLIAFNAGFSFLDFIRWSFPASLAALAIVIGVAEVMLRPIVRRMGEAAKKPEVRRVFQVEWSPELRTPLILFTVVLAGLVVHHELEALLGLPHNTLLLAVPLMGAGIALVLEHRKAREIVERRVDWWTLLYFILLFASVGALVYTGVTTVIAERIYQVSQGNLLLAMVLMSAVTGLLTAFMDNVLAVATLIPVVKALAETGMNVFLLWWVLLIAGTYWGNATVIGSTANIVAAGYIEKKYRRTFSMTGWMKIGVPICFITYAVAFLWLVAQMPIAPKWVPPAHITAAVH